MAKRSAAPSSVIAGALPHERHTLIIERLHTHGRLIAADFAAELGISEDSIRRDLRELASQGLCKRVYGGALPFMATAPLKQRQEQNTERKLALARAAASLVREGQVLLIDAGSTNSAIASALPANLGLTVITNAPDIAQRLIGRDGFTIVMVGGRIDTRIGAAVGAQALNELKHLRADVCLPGACAIDAELGLWSVDSEEAQYKRAMIEASGETIVAVTDDKLGAAATHRIVEIAEVHQLVVEASAPKPIVTAFRKHGVSVTYADPAD
jgi:DeoR/GlpR family transcriptional regulator of sugar metabolism